jgi:hypothetical protein
MKIAKDRFSEFRNKTYEDLLKLVNVAYSLMGIELK